jgi:hypothetical protein
MEAKFNLTDPGLFGNDAAEEEIEEVFFHMLLTLKA